MRLINPKYLALSLFIIFSTYSSGALSEDSIEKKLDVSAKNGLESANKLQNGTEAKVYSLSVKRAPFGDTLHIIASEADLNLVFDSGVNTDVFITVTFKNLPLKDAIEALLYPFGYFYNIEKNIIFVRAVTTRHFELGSPPVIQNLSTQLGGDILGGAVAAVKGTTSGLTGAVSISGQSDSKAINFWDYIEASLKSILNVGGGGGTTSGQTGGGQTTATGGGQTNTAATNASQSTTASSAVLSINRSIGTITITGTKRQIEDAEVFINRVRDVINKQVVIEAKIVEVTLSDGIKYGIDWENIIRTKTTISASGFKSVVKSSDPVFSINFASSDFGVVLKALEEQGSVKVLSNPTLNIVNGQTGLLSAGRSTSFISKVERTLTQSTPPIETVTVETSGVLSGIIIGVTPYIEENGEVVLMVTPIISELISLTDKTVSTTTLSLPTVDLREMTSIVRVRDEEMIAIGGLIKEKNTVAEKGVPILGKIPVISLLFKNKETVNERTELVLFLKPTIRKANRK